MRLRVLSYERTGYLTAALAIVNLVAGAAFAAERPAGGPAGGGSTGGGTPAVVDSTDTTKYEFGSEAWVSLARDYLAAAVGDADLEGIRFSFCEVYTDPPAHLLEPGESTTGWYVSIADGVFRVEKGVLAKADILITSDYATTLPLAQIVFEGNPGGAVQAQEMVEAATTAGKMRREGDASAFTTVATKVPALAAAFAKLHDTLARRTL